MSDSDDVVRHEALVPMGTQVSSKGRFRNCRGVGPAWTDYGMGAYVYDKGHGLIDWSCGLGALTIGHGWTWGTEPECLPLPHRNELLLAELLHEWVPCAEMVRFLKTGTDATSAAVRIARVYTGRDMILDAGNYHGNQDWSVSAEHEGIPRAIRDLTHTATYGNVGMINNLLHRRDYACLILEPVSLIAPPEKFLADIRKICDETGTVLIFDEVITGIRMAKGGAQEVYGVKPDLCAIGKGLANGYPISAVCGKRELMECWSRTHLSGTHYGDPSCMKAALRTMAHLVGHDFWGHQAYIGSALLDGVRKAIDACGVAEHVKAVGHPHWWVLQVAKPVHQTYVQQELIREGVLGSNGSHFVSLSHREEEVEVTLRAYHHALVRLSSAIALHEVDFRLECETNRTVFRRT